MSFKVGIKFKNGEELLLENATMACLNPDYNNFLMYSIVKEDGAQIDIPFDAIQYISFSKERREQLGKGKL